MINKLSFSLLAITLAVTSAFANQDKPIISSVVITKNQPPTGQEVRKKVVLMPMRLTDKQMKAFYRFKSEYSIKPHQLKQPYDLPSSVQLGMNDVPVLDQGMHGSCVTFAVTGAIDALIQKGDYISQLCSLELGKYLEGKGYYYSGWNGSWDFMVLNQFSQFGFINKEKQLSGSCAGVKEYPTNNMGSEGKPLSLDEHDPLSETLNTSSTAFVSDPIVTIPQRVKWTQENLDADKTLIKVKEALSNKEEKVTTRVVFAVALPIDYCSAGACGKFHNQDDTWAYTESMKKDDNMWFGGHEMIITGYDDNAVAVDRDGNKHYGLLTLRNSWGEDVGDNGDYYMTYEFFKNFVWDVQKLSYATNLSQARK